MSILDLFRSTENKKVRQFETRLDEIETQMRLIRMEWNEAYDKVAHALDRVAKRWNRINIENQADQRGDAKQSQIGGLSTADLWKIARDRGMVR